MNQEQTKFTKLDFESWREKASRLGILSDRTKQLAQEWGIEVRDGWYNVSNIATVDGSPWVCEQEFLEIVKDLLDE